MILRSKKLYAIGGFLGSLIFLHASVLACGIRWDQPKAHFDGVDDDASVLWSEQIDTLDLGSGLRVPIYVMFKSNWLRNSPILGNGWMLPLLESSFVQVDEGKYRMTQPGGWYRMFHQEKKDPTLLNGGTWQAEIKGDTISAWAECGDKVVFNGGRIQSMTLNGRTFTFVYSGNRVTEIREGGATRLNVIWEGSGVAKALEFNGKRIELEQGDKPRVQGIGGRNVIGGMDKSLSRIASNAGGTKMYEFAVDEHLRPTLKAGNRLLTWNPETQLIVSDGEWNYSVTPGDEPGAYAAIERKNTLGQRESWHENKKKGVEIVETADGIKTITTKFRRGLMAGKKRKREQYKNGQLVGSESWTYDEKGLLIRAIDNEKITTFLHDDMGRLISSHDEGGKLIMSFDYDEKNRMVKKTDASGKVLWERAFDEEGRIVRELTNGMLIEHQFAVDGIRKKIQKDPVSGAILRRWSYDVEGRNTDFTTLNGDSYRIAYNAQGRKNKVFRNGSLEELFVYDGGDLIKQVSFRPGGKQIENIIEFGTSLGVRSITKVLTSSDIANGRDFFSVKI